MSDEMFMKCPRCDKKPYVWYDYGFIHAKCDCHRCIGVGDTHFEMYMDVLMEWTGYLADVVFDSEAMKNSRCEDREYDPKPKALTLEEMRAKRLKELEEGL